MPQPRAVSDQRSWQFAALLLLLATCAIGWPWLSGIVVIPWDAKAHSYAQLQFLAQSLHDGDSPFWTPNVFAGSPQIADPQSLIFSPPFLLLAFLSGDPSFRAAHSVVFLMLFLAGLAMQALFRDRGWRVEGAMVASLSLAFGGSVAWRLQHVGEVLSLCWFVIALFLLARALGHSSTVGRAIWGLAAGVVAGLMVVGRDQIAYLCMLVLVLYVIGHVFAQEGFVRRLRMAILPLSAGMVGGLLTAAVPIAFSIALAAQSNRPAIDFEGAAKGALHPAAFLTMIAANLFGTDGPMSAYWGPPSTLVWGPNDFALARNMGTLYFGALPIAALLGIGLLAGRLFRREVVIFTLAVILLILYALGGYTPFFKLIFAFPGVDLFRRPADATFPLCALLSLLAGYCVHCLVSEGQSRFIWRSLAAVLPALAFSAALARHFGRLDQATPALLTAVFFFCLALTAMWVLARREIDSRLALLLVAGVLTLDLAVSNKPNESTALPPQTYDILRPDTRNATIIRLKSLVASTAGPDRRDRVEMAAIDFQWPNAGLVHGLDHDLGYNPIRLKVFEDATHAEDQVAVPEQRAFSPLFPSYRSPLADMLGLRYIATGVPIEQIDPALKPGDLRFLGRTTDAYLYENPRALPRVLLATRAVVVDFESMERTGVWPTEDWRRTISLERAPAITPRNAPEATGTARLLIYRNTRIDVEASAPAGGGWVVLNDVWHPWWRAQVDGIPVVIQRANVMFRAVEVPPGRHQVRFEFAPFAGLWLDVKRLAGLP